MARMASRFFAFWRRLLGRSLHSWILGRLAHIRMHLGVSYKLDGAPTPSVARGWVSPLAILSVVKLSGGPRLTRRHTHSHRHRRERSHDARELPPSAVNRTKA